MITALELKDDIEMYIKQNLDILSNKYPELKNYSVQSNKYNNVGGVNIEEYRVENVSDSGVITLHNNKNTTIPSSTNKLNINYNKVIEVSVIAENTVQMNDINDLTYVVEGDIISLVDSPISEDVYIIVDIESNINSHKHSSKDTLTSLFYVNILVGTTNYIDNKETFNKIFKEVNRLFNNTIHITTKCNIRHYIVQYNTNKLNVDNVNDKVGYILLTMSLTENKKI